MLLKRLFSPISLVLLVAILALFFFYTFTKTSYLSFSDSAKYADLARNIVDGNGYGLNFTFWNDTKLNSDLEGLFDTSILPIHPLLIAGLFKAFGVSDFSVTLVSMVFYALSGVLIYLLGNKLFGRLAGFLSSIAFLTTSDILNYAVNGGTESLFIFEILLSLYLFSLKRKTYNLFGILVFVLMYFTRSQAFIYIAGSLLFYFLLNFDIKKSVYYFFLFLAGYALMDVLILKFFPQATFIYSIFSVGSFVAAYVGAGQATSDILRGVKVEHGITEIVKRVFYNLYNFYKLAPQIINPYILGLFVIGFFRNFRNKSSNAFKWASVFMVFLTLLVAASSIPLFRYIHPVVPLIYLLSVDTLVFMGTKIFENSETKISKPLLLSIFSSLVILIFIIGPTMGIIFLDSRFERKTKNIGKPPVYVEMAKVLQDSTDSGDLIVTNLDTWGSWYGQRKTVWFPLSPSELNIAGRNNFDAIFLTNYLINDENYLMGEEWRQILENPEHTKNDYIRENYDYKLKFVFPSSDNYERFNGEAILLTKKKDCYKMCEKD